MPNSQETSNLEEIEGVEVPMVEGVEVPMLEAVEVPVIEPVDSTDELNNNYSKVTIADSDDELRNFGLGIAVCAILLLFGGETFAVWNLEYEVGAIELNMLFGVNEQYVEGSTFDNITGEMEDTDDSVEYDDSDCDCKEVESFFSNLKILIYILLIGGVFIGYMGNTGEKLELLPKALAAVIAVSAIIMLYTFFSLPEAFEEESELFDAIDEDPAFFSDHKEDIGLGIIVKLKTTVSLGFFVPLISMGLAGYQIKERGIKLEHITG